MIYRAKGYSYKVYNIINNYAYSNYMILLHKSKDNYLQGNQDTYFLNLYKLLAT